MLDNLYAIGHGLDGLGITDLIRCHIFAVFGLLDLVGFGAAAL